MSKKVVLSILILSLVLITGCQKKEDPQTGIKKSREDLQVSPDKKDLINSSEMTDWQTYTNEKYSYSLKYPKDWFFMKDACCPPPPAFVSLNNISEKKEDYTKVQLEKSSLNFDILCLYEGSLDEIGEVSSQKEEGVKNMETEVNGFKTIKFTKNVYPGNDTENVISYYVVDGTQGCRITFFDKCTVCDKILSTFKFAE